MCLSTATAGIQPRLVAAAPAPLPPVAGSQARQQIDTKGMVRYGQLWWWGWLGVHAAASVGNGVMAGLRTDQGEREGAIFSAVGAGITAIEMGIFYEPSALPGRYASHCQWLQAAAKRQKAYRSPLALVTPALWSAGVATYLQLRFGDPLLTSRVAGGALLVSAARILTSPQSAIEAYAAARRDGTCSSGAEPNRRPAIPDASRGDLAVVHRPHQPHLPHRPYRSHGAVTSAHNPPKLQLSLAPAPGGLALVGHW